MKEWASSLWGNGALLGLMGVLLCLALLIYGVDE